MSAFRLFRQNPHFQNLLLGKKGSREGSAITLMVDFVNVVEKTRTLEPDDPKNILDDMVEILHKVEYNGFDVNAVREHVVQLLSIKDNREEHKVKAKKPRDQIEEEEEKNKYLNNHIRLVQD
ncbi:DUF724 domain-containing protein 5-like [Apium graveolens]|uniref:DUF724 domain-containing protein 5-like n=1 Tax=Apium graveolens TaxID=4045 RepID=UPI003D7BA0EB